MKQKVNDKKDFIVRKNKKDNNCGVKKSKKSRSKNKRQSSGNRGKWKKKSSKKWIKFSDKSFNDDAIKKAENSVNKKPHVGIDYSDVYNDIKLEEDYEHGKHPTNSITNNLNDATRSKNMDMSKYAKLQNVDLDVMNKISMKKNNKVMSNYEAALQFKKELEEIDKKNTNHEELDIIKGNGITNADKINTNNKDVYGDTKILQTRFRKLNINEERDETIFMKDIITSMQMNQGKYSVDNEYDCGIEYLMDDKRKKDRKMTLGQMKHNQINKEKNQYYKMQSIYEKCNLCFNAITKEKDMLISIGTMTYLTLTEDYIVTGHCFIIPIDHIPSIRSADQDTLNEIRNFKKCLIQMFQGQELDVIFIETAINLSDYKKHAYIECIPVPHKKFEIAPSMFKKSIEDATYDWSTHHIKTCIETKNKGLEGCIPKHFPYFNVEFGLLNGYVHVIENEMTFDKNMGKKTLVGLLDLPVENSYIKKELKVNERQTYMSLFLEHWKSYDWTRML